MIFTENISQGLAIIADGIHPASQTANTYLTAAIDLSKVRRVAFLVDIGVISASGTVNFQVVGASTSGGSYSAITGTAIAQMSQAGSNSNQYAWVEVRVEQLVALNLGVNFIKGQLVTATAAALAGVICFADVARYEPASGLNATTVNQTVVL